MERAIRFTLARQKTAALAAERRDPACCLRYSHPHGKLLSDTVSLAVSDAFRERDFLVGALVYDDELRGAHHHLCSDVFLLSQEKQSLRTASKILFRCRIRSVGHCLQLVKPHHCHALRRSSHQ
jgi:hypothetical protein